MVRVLLYLIVLAALAFGFAQIADLPGTLSIKWPWWPLHGKTIEVAPIVGLTIALAGFVVFYLIVALLRFILRIPSIMSFTARARRQNKGVAAVSRGMIAAGAGDARAAERATREALKLLGPTPLALLLQAQSAQLAGNRQSAEQAFKQMTENPETRVIGLRGLYLEARRAGNDEAAHAHAQEAHAIAALPWAGQAILEKHTMGEDWRGALAVVEANIARKAIDKDTGNRQRAVLKTAIALEIADREPDEALQLSREAIKLNPALVPAYAVAGKMLARKGDIRRGARILEAGWKVAPHPDIAAAYLDLRPGDSQADRLARAQTLARINSGHIESRLMLARTALETRAFALARKTIDPLIAEGSRPTVRTCLFMADLEQTENGPSGHMREWLARATRAPRDPMWIADGLASDTWAPASPVTGRLDAFVWETPAERLTAPETPFKFEEEEIPQFIPPLPPKDEVIEIAAQTPREEAVSAPADTAAGPVLASPVSAEVDGKAAPEPAPSPAAPATQATAPDAPGPSSPAPVTLAELPVAKPAAKKPIAGQPDDPGPR